MSNQEGLNLAEMAKQLDPEQIAEILAHLPYEMKAEAEAALNKMRRAEGAARANTPEMVAKTTEKFQALFDAIEALHAVYDDICARAGNFKRYRVRGLKGGKFYALKDEAWKNALYKFFKYFAQNSLYNGDGFKDMFPGLTIPDVVFDPSKLHAKKDDVEVSAEEYEALDIEGRD